MIRRDARSWMRTAVRTFSTLQSASSSIEPSSRIGAAALGENRPNDSSLRTTPIWLNWRPVFSPPTRSRHSCSRGLPFPPILSTRNLGAESDKALRSRRKTLVRLAGAKKSWRSRQVWCAIRAACVSGRLHRAAPRSRRVLGFGGARQLATPRNRSARALSPRR